MKKKLIALAVAGATLAPLAAMAQTTNPVTLYGRVYETFESVKANGAAGGAGISTRNRVTDQSSFLGVRGTEDIGGGVKAFFQLETVFRADQTGSSFANRNSAVGFQGNFGSFLLGRWDTPFKVATTAVDPFGDLTIGGITAALNDRGNFDRRENNVVQYWSPNIAGFQARASYSANEGKTATVNPSALSFSATYTQGPFYAGYAWERHKDQYKSYLGALANVSGASEKGQSVFGTATFGPVKVGALAQWFIKRNDANPIGSRKGGNKSAMVTGTYTFGNNQIHLVHQRAEDGTTLTTGNAAAPEAKCKVNVVGYQYNFSRRTFVLGQYASIKNETFGQCDIAGDRLGVAAGQDPRGLSVGIRHLF
jgi:predicted porin